MKMIKKVLVSVPVVALVYLGISLALVFWPAPEKKDVENYDYSTLENGVQNYALGEEKWLTLRDESKLFYRVYPSDANSTLIMIHGSGAESRYLRNMATSLAESGISRVITPDLRGHGRTTKEKGDINYIGQYDHDIEDVVNYVRSTYPGSKIILGGHSSGGGLVLRYAGNTEVSKVDGYIMFAPYLGHEAPTVKPNSGDWVTVAIPRFVGLSMLNSIGITKFNHMPVLIFNRPDAWTDELQASGYSYRLTTSFGPNNYASDIRLIDRPALVIIGSEDESFYAEKFEQVFAEADELADVEVISGVKHLDVVNDKQAHSVISSWYAKVTGS